jgi:hypothetical protein
MAFDGSKVEFWLEWNQKQVPAVGNVHVGNPPPV